MTATPASGRLQFVDLLRGFALFGVFWANLLIFSSIEYLTEEQRASLFLGRLVIDPVCLQVEAIALIDAALGDCRAAIGSGDGLVRAAVSAAVSPWARRWLAPTISLRYPS